MIWSNTGTKGVFHEFKTWLKYQGSMWPLKVEKALVSSSPICIRVSFCKWALYPEQTQTIPDFYVQY